MPSAQRHFGAMGTDCHVLVDAPAGTPAVLVSDLLDAAVQRVGLLESSWSRFRPDSDLSRLNASAGGGPVAVSGDLLVLVERMVTAWQESAGLFDPTVLTSVTALGYDEDFAAVNSRPTGSAAAALPVAGIAPAPGMAGILVDPMQSTVSLPAGVGIDPGAIGKGLAADLIVSEMTEAGASAVLVNLGGDVSFAGALSDGAPWCIGIQDERRPADSKRLLTLLEFDHAEDRAAVATSTTLKRRWAQGRRHHVIDPRTGTMADGDLLQVSVVAGEAWWAEAAATTALLMPAADAVRWLRERGLTAYLLTAERELTTDSEISLSSTGVPA
ncbi:MAG: FAD:protein FMN transferase [Actinomycetota bacterium]|nr:FAD:protein FMN transferase [Actinomycetota bacterium]